MEFFAEADNKKIERFLNKLEINFPQHGLGWKNAIEKSYSNLKPICFVEEEKGEIKCFLPFFIVKSKIFGNKMISLPFIDFGGHLGYLKREFLKKVVDYTKKNLNVNYIEIRLNDFSKLIFEETKKVLMKEKFQPEGRKNQIILKLKNEEELFGDLERVTRKAIRKAEKSELGLKKMDDLKELRAFYKLYSQNMRGFGTPQHSFKFFKNLMSEKNMFKGLNCYRGEKLIASLIIIYTKSYAYAAYAASDNKYLKYQPNDLLYWELIKWSARKGLFYFDLGQCDANSEERSHARGIYKFKKKWSGEAYNKTYFYYLLNSNLKKKKKVLKENKGKFSKIWKRLPRLFTNIIGPKIASQLGL